MKDVFKFLIDRDLDKLITEINLYPSDSSLWVVTNGITNSGGNLSLHICGSLRHFIGAILGKDGYIRDREREFSAKDLSKQELLEEIEKAKNAVSTTLDKISQTTLEAPFPMPCPIPDATAMVFITHLYGHLGYHLGQINYHRRLLTN